MTTATGATLFTEPAPAQRRRLTTGPDVVVGSIPA